MGIRCSVFGHSWGDTLVEREREEGESEVVITVREVRECERCGARDVQSENTEVTALSRPDTGPSDGSAEPARSDATAGSPSTDATDADATPDTDATREDAATIEDDATIIDDEPGDETSEVNDRQWFEDRTGDQTETGPADHGEPTPADEGDTPADASNTPADTAETAAAGSPADEPTETADSSTDEAYPDDDATIIRDAETGDPVGTVQDDAEPEDAQRDGLPGEASGTDVSDAEADDGLSAEEDDGIILGDDEPAPDLGAEVGRGTERDDRTGVDGVEPADASPSTGTPESPRSDPVEEPDGTDDVGTTEYERGDWPEHEGIDEDATESTPWPEHEAPRDVAERKARDAERAADTSDTADEGSDSPMGDEPWVDTGGAGGREPDHATADDAEFLQETEPNEQSDISAAEPVDPAEALSKAAEEQAEAEVVDDEPGGPRIEPDEDEEMEVYCSNCGFVDDSPNPSLRGGDACPRCRKAYLNERERDT